MRYAVYTLWSLACGCGMYAGGAVVWSTIDPEGAGRALLFTIPIAVVALAVFALLATVGLMIPFGWDAPEATSKPRARKVAVSADPSAKPQAAFEEREAMLAG
jgi:hypothetical protein